MRVLFVNAGVALGGAEHSLLLLLDGLRDHGIAVTVAVFGEGPFRDRLVREGIPATLLRVAGSLRRATRYRIAGATVAAPVLAADMVVAVLRAAILVRRLRADLVHSNGLKAHVLAALVGVITGTPVVWHLRDFPPAGLPGRVLRLMARSLPRLVLTNSDSVAGAIGTGGQAKILRLYNPVDFRSFHPGRSRTSLRRELGFDEATLVAGMVAHLTPWKGHKEFLATARAVLTQVPEARFVIAGGEIYETSGHAGYGEALRRCAKDLGLGDRVKFLGARDDAADVIAALDVLVHCPTEPEPFGRAIAEAMAVGRPVVAARSGGIPEIVDDGVTGFLVDPDDIDGVAAAVVKLLTDRALAVKLGGAGSERARELFDPEVHAASVLAAYRDILSRSA